MLDERDASRKTPLDVSLRAPRAVSSTPRLPAPRQATTL
jgi:hypothetical protein